MAESGIDLNYDLSALLTDDFDIESAIDFDDLLGTPKNQEYYQLTSKTMPVSESHKHWYKVLYAFVKTPYLIELHRVLLRISLDSTAMN
ncbi:hypothetical protein HUJ05_003053 [Dendroctonus ponderosae]|nr:hypothetical protein HUJ05_003053 [Dendroctonus ponderosae]